jgi:hypothetical protein
MRFENVIDENKEDSNIQQIKEERRRKKRDQVVEVV